MKKLCCVLVLAAMSSTAWAECTYPKAPSKFPSGRSATKDEMVAAMKINKAYQADVNAYQQCLKSEHDAALAKDPAMSEDQKQKVTKRYIEKNDAAVDEAAKVAERFNEQVRVFNAKEKK